MILISQMFIEVYDVSAPLHVVVNPSGRLLIYTIPCVTLLIVIFITDAGHPDIKSCWYTRCLGSVKG